MIAKRMLEFLKGLEPPKLPKGISVMNPYHNKETLKVVEAFYLQFYNDKRERTLLLGINPGRFGAGVTGISFTDPIRLERDCGIPNHLPKKPELSSDFVYRVIEAYGGPTKFYSRYLVSAVSPLGFTREGKNINYYDDRKLQQAVRPFAADCINNLTHIGVSRKRCYCIGEGKNLAFLQVLNAENHWFEEIIPLPHPRFIMQYKRKHLDNYIRTFIAHLV